MEAILSSKRRKTGPTTPLSSSLPPPIHEMQQNLQHDQHLILQSQQLSPSSLPKQQQQQQQQQTEQILTTTTTTTEQKKSSEISSILPAVIQHFQVFPPAVRSTPAPLHPSTTVFSSMPSILRNPLPINGQSETFLQKSTPFTSFLQNPSYSLQQK
jgi:hypothetical protein